MATPKHGPVPAIVLILLFFIGIWAALVYLPGLLSHHRRNISPQVTATATNQPLESTPATIPGSHIHWHPTRRTGPELKVLDKKWFQIGYDESRKNPAWVIYELAGPITHPGPEPTRPATFQTDFATAAHVSHRDYSGSECDRGHMCPAYAEWSRNGTEAFLATFVCSNIIPQPHRVNAGIWEELETKIAGRWSGHGGQPAGGGWAERYGAVTVINGPIYREPTETLRNGTVIPAVDFSVVIRQDGNVYQAQAFEIPNEGDPRGPLDRYLVSIKQVEDDTGLDLFTGEAGALRARLETERATENWR